MSFLIIYSLVLGTIFTLSVFMCSCTYCLSTCANMSVEDSEEEGELPESVKHMYS